MYLIINNKRYSLSKRIVDNNKIIYLSLNPAADEGISGQIEMYRDDGFLLSTDKIENYKKIKINGSQLILTNEPDLVITIPKHSTPKENREHAYETEVLISFGGDGLTVDQANKLWYQYAAEGNTEITSELTQKISEAKNEIRAKYPDPIDEEQLDESSEE